MPADFSLLKLSLSEASKKSLGLAGIVSGIFGFIADVLQPIAPFASYLCLISLVIFIILLCGCVFSFIKRDLLPLTIFFGLSFLMTGALTVMNDQDEEEKKGVFATMMPALENLQTSLGLIQKDVAEIKETTTDTNETAKRIEDKIGTISQLGGIINDPTTPEDFYHNARLHEQGGNYAAARQSYARYFQSDLEKLDPHLRYLKFLKIQEGRAGARETYAAVTEDSAGIIPQYVKILFLNGRPKVDALEAFSKEHPKFAPAYYHLAQAYSLTSLGKQTHSELRAELDYTTKFLEAAEEGGLVKYFVDQEMLAKWKQEASGRKKIIDENLGEAFSESSLTSKITKQATGWQVMVTIAEPHLEIFWKWKGSTDEEESTGTTGSIHPQTGKPMPVPFFTLPIAQKPGTLEISYLDARGKRQGPFETEFDPVALDSDQSKNMSLINMTKTNWVSLQGNPAAKDDLLLYFTGLLTWRGAIKEIRYGLNKDEPDTEFKFPAYKGADAAPVPEDFLPYLDVPDDTKTVSVQVIFKDGTKSKVQPFTLKAR